MQAHVLVVVASWSCSTGHKSTNFWTAQCTVSGQLLISRSDGQVMVLW